MLHDIVKKGATDRSVTIRIIDSSDGTPETGVVFNTSGIDLWYRREGAAKTSITEADLATPALTDAHADGGFLHIGDGYYRLDLPDAAFATGANHVDFGGTVTGMIVIGGRVRLVDYDPEDAVRAGLTALPNAAADAAGGLPISDAGGLDLDTLLGRLDAAISTRAAAAKLLAYLQLALRSDAAIATDNATELTEINADGGSGGGDFANTADAQEAAADAVAGVAGNVGTPVSIDGGAATLGGMLTKMADDNSGADFDATTDSLQAIRDRGDAAWTTGGGGSISDILNLQPVIPNSIDLANTATVRLGLMLTNALDDLPSTAEITPGTISIERKAIGGTSWTSVVADGACSEQAGLIYYDEVFDSGTGYAEGDSIRVTFKSQKITVSANDYEITDANGVMFQTYIRETMRGTDGANTATPLDAAGVRSAVGLNAADLDTQLDAIPTAAENRAEMDSNSTQLAAIVSAISGLNDPAASAIADAVLDEALSGHATAGTLGKAISDALADTNELQGDWADGGRLDLLIDAMKVVIDALPDSGALTSLAQASELATVDGNVDAIKAITDAIGATAAAKLALTLGSAGAPTFAAEAGTLSTTQATTDLAEATDDHYIGRVVIWTTGALAGQATDITDYAGSNGLLTFTALTEAPQAGDTGVIV